MSLKNAHSYIIFLLLIIPICSVAQRNDILILKNGDHIMGEIKKWQYGALTFKTDDAGTLTINCIDVMRLRSLNRFELTDRSGLVRYGSLDTTSKNREIILVMDSVRKVININDLAKAIPVKNKFLTRLDGSIRIGVNFSKSSDVLKLNINGGINYRSLHDKISLDGNSEVTWQNQADTTEITKKQDITVSYSRYFNKRWFLASIFGLEQNTGLGLKLRTSLAFGGGKELFQNDLHSLNTAVGLSGNIENSTDNTKTYNLEGAVLINYKIYKFTRPKISLNSSLYTYPSLSNLGRVRLTGNISVDFEFFKDFIFSISNYDNYDNKPATEGASKFDWGITTSIGYSF
jgi:hypothetical protein